MLTKSDDLTLDELVVRLEQMPEAANHHLLWIVPLWVAFNAASRLFTLPPYLYKVLSIGDVKSSDADLKRHSLLPEEDQVLLDLLHLQKMRQSRVVCFLNLLQHFGVSGK